MTCYIFPIAATESDSHADWMYVAEHRDDWVDFDTDISSIDMGISCDPRFVVNNTAYYPMKQYFVVEGSSTTLRVIVAKEVRSA